MLGYKHNKVFWRCGTSVFAFFVIVFSSKADTYRKTHSLKQYKPIPYRSYGNDVRTVKRIVNDVSYPRQSVTPIRTSSTRTIIPRGRRLIYSVTRPLRIRKVLTEQDGKLVYKEMPKERTFTHTRSKVSSTEHFPTTISKSSKTIDRNFDLLEPPLDRFPGHNPAPNYGTRYNQPISVFNSRHNEPKLKRPQLVSTSFNSHQRPSSSSIQSDLHGYNNFGFPSVQSLPGSVYTENERKFLSNIQPPTGLKMVVVRENMNYVDLESSRYRKYNSPTISPKKRHRFHAPTTFHATPQKPSSKVLRIRVATMDEARALLANVGPGFKVTVINETTSASTPFLITASSQTDETTLSVTFVPTTVPSTSISLAEPTKAADLKQWWNGYVNWLVIRLLFDVLHANALSVITNLSKLQGIAA